MCRKTKTPNIPPKPHKEGSGTTYMTGKNWLETDSQIASPLQA